MMRDASGFRTVQEYVPVRVLLSIILFATKCSPLLKITEGRHVLQYFKLFGQVIK